MRITLAVVALSLSALPACGGKILDEGRSAAPPGASGDFGDQMSRASDDQDPVAVPPPGLPQPTKSTSGDACDTVCHRNGECGAWQSDCNQSCTDELRPGAACSAEAGAYIHCYADNLIDGCAALPPVCEASYCAYARCTGKVVPSYCR
jgi:hypothetical protein